ncbi:MAG: hypothetical protein SVU32_01470 [Candidatus Nanohaloarchaea archaeon]|nr:hypothetical protein [Candidatus Nanohaloarchaea archaeon]
MNQTDSSQAACNAFINAQGQGNWTTDSIIAEASGQAGGPCNLGLTNDKFIAGNAFYEDGKSTVCREGTQESVTINGQTYYCRGVTN